MAEYDDVVNEYRLAMNGTMPHCFAIILHIASECVYCAARDDLQQLRISLNMSNTGYTNRKWPCPADAARSQTSQNSWHGNRPMNQDAINTADAEWDIFVESQDND